MSQNKTVPVQNDATDVVRTAVSVQQSIPAPVNVPNAFAAAAQNAAIAEGSDVVDQSALVGVPFVITSATFRDGKSRRDGGNIIPTNYVSLEIIVGDDAALAKAMERAKRRGLGDAVSNLGGVDACERLVVNDGSTGIYRQIVAFLHAQNIITLPDGADSGIAGMTRYDTYRAEWQWAGKTGEPEDPRCEFALLCMRGLRKSDYKYDGDSDATTFYIA